MTPSLGGRVALGLLVVSFCVQAGAGLNADAGDPFGRTATEIPGLIQAEAFDLDDYSEKTPTEAFELGLNGCVDFRMDQDLDTFGVGNGGYAIYCSDAGENMRYAVDVTGDVDAFDFRFSMGSGVETAFFRIVSGGTGCDDFTTDLSGIVNVPFTAGYDIFTELTVSGQGDGGLPAGSAYIWLCTLSCGYSLDSFSMVAASRTPQAQAPFLPTTTSMETTTTTTTTTISTTPISTTPITTTPISKPPISTSTDGPYGGTAAAIPGVIEAEEFDLGGEGVGYSDSTDVNKGGVFRTEEGVDIEARGPGYTVGAITAGEYLRYTVDVTKDVDAFVFNFLVASNRDTASFRVVSGGTGCDDYITDLSGLVEVPFTGARTIYEILEVYGQGDGGLDAGQAYVWLCALSEHFNIDAFTMAEAEFVPTTHGGTPAAIPDLLLSDTNTPSTSPGEVARVDESVAVGSSTDDYFVGWTTSGGYLQYTVDVSDNGFESDFSSLVAGLPNTCGSFRIVAGGTGCVDYETDLSGVVSAPPDGWSSYSDVQIFDAEAGGMAAGPGVTSLCVLPISFEIDTFSTTAPVGV